MLQMVLNNEVLMAKIHPNREFWESHLEMPLDRLIQDYQDAKIRKNWLDSLSGRQLGLLFDLSMKKPPHELSVQQMRKTLTDFSEELINYFLVHHFNHAKLEAAITEIAKPVLSAETMAKLLVKDDKYDKKGMLFALFKADPELLKHVYHFDKVQKKGFGCFVLKNPPRQPVVSFKEFASEDVIRAALKAHDEEQNDSFETHLQGLFYHEDRLYLFIRRASDEDLLLSSNRIVHGHKPDWIILDFAANANQVNLCAKCSNQGLKIADRLVSSYFEKDCFFINMQDYNFAAQVKTFLRSCASEIDKELKLFELKFRSPHLKNNTHLILTTHPTDPIADELEALHQAIGDILDDIAMIDSVRVVFQGKKVTLFFRVDAADPGHVMICYSEYVLDKKGRSAFKTWMKDCYGLTILPKAKCCA
jgi:hypothetical protein